MRKSEKVKGKEEVGARKKQYLQYAIVAVVGVAILAVVVFIFFNPFVAKTGDTVAIYFTGTLDNGTVIASNVNTTPFIFTIGKDETLPSGLPNAVIGMHPNETKTVILPPEKAFGIYQPSLVQVVNRSSLPADMNPVVGVTYTITRKSDNAVASVKILNVTPTTITWDENHPLAGQNLTLTITLVEILQK
jgi:peptidylprolyl isomerase